MTLNWGIASSGLIANDFVKALKGLPKDEHQVVAVAARSLESAEKFAKTNNIPEFYEGYKNLATDERVQIVYIGVLNPQHYDVVILMLENGKHVLCEKPFALNEKQARKMIELAKSKNLFVMEAIWSRFFPVYQTLRTIIDSGEIGEVKYITATFGIPLTHVERVKRKDLGGSAILDIGVYLLQFQQFFFRGLKPQKIVVAGHTNENGVDDAASVIFTYPGGKTAVVSCNATVELPNEGIIVGTKGTIKIPVFWCPLKYEINGKVQEIPLIKNDETFNYLNSAGLAYQAIDIRKQIEKGNIESDLVPHEETLQLAAWMDTVRRELGVVFPEDLE